MPVNELTATVRHRNGASVVDLEGEINVAADGPLRAAYTDTAGPHRPVVELNFEGVRYIDSTGIGLLVELLARARADQRTVAACGLIDHYRMLFEITRLSDFMGMYPDEDSAVRGVSATGAKEDG